MMEFLHKEITEQIIGAAFEVHRFLGYSFLEKVYQKALQIELQLRGLKAEFEKDIRVYYKGEEVGYYKADSLVNECVIVELKVAKTYCSDDEAQLLNELKATNTKVGMLVNFGRAKVEFKRMVY